MTPTQQRIQAKDNFKDLISYLRKLENHLTKKELLSKEDLEDLDISVDIIMDDLKTMVDDHYELGSTTTGDNNGE